MANAKDLCFDKGNGLLPVIAQDHETGEVLMLAYMNRQAWEKSKGTDGSSLDGYLNALLQSKNWSKVLEESRKYIDGRNTLKEIIDLLMADLDRKGLDVLSKKKTEEPSKG